MSQSLNVFKSVAPDDEAVASIQRYYGFPEDAFADHRFWRRADSGSLWMAHRSVPGPELGDGLGDGIGTVGIRVLREAHPPLRIGNGFLRRFGALATRNCVILSEEEALTWLHNEPLLLPDKTRQTRNPCIVLGPWGPMGRGRWMNDRLHCEASKMTRLQPRN